MTKFNREMFDCVLYTFLNLSDAEMEPWVRKEINEFAAKPYTSKELYLFLDKISKIPISRIGKIVVGHISGSMQAAADVTKYYIMPEDDEAKMLDHEDCERKLKSQ